MARREERELAKRREEVGVRVGSTQVGAGAPIVIQSMTNTDTADVDATCQQVCELAEAGSELVRIPVNRAEAAAAVRDANDLTNEPPECRRSNGVWRTPVVQLR